MTTRVHLVLGGGAMLGIGHVGALKALLHVPNLEIVSVAGTSAGAVFGALVSSRHTPSEIEQMVFQMPFESWLDPLSGVHFREVREAFKDLARLPKELKPWDLIMTLIRHRKLIKPLYNAFSGHAGLCKGDSLENWVQRALAQKLDLDPSKPVLFSDLQATGIPLCVVATNLNAGSAYQFGTEHTPDESVARGVRASASLPLIFQSVKSGRGVDLVDGGLIANLPVYQISSSVQADDYVVTVTVRSEVVIDRPANNMLEVAWSSFEAARSVQQVKPPIGRHVPIDIVLKLDPLDFSPNEDLVWRSLDLAYQQAKNPLAILGV